MTGGSAGHRAAPTVPEHGPSTGRTNRQIIAFLAALSALTALSIDTALPALGDIREAFGLDPDDNQVTQVVTWFFLGTAVGQIVYGPFADRFGRAPVLRVALCVYAVGALVATTAGSLSMLFAGRFVWGLGAAAPAVMRTTIARDLYRGDEMAKVMSVVMSVFLLAPVIAPSLGVGLIALGSWRWVFAIGVLLAAIQLVWSFRFGETLDPANRRPLTFRRTFAAVRAVASTRSTRWYIAALTLNYGAFYVFLGSSQPIFDTIYGREAQFPLLFGASAVVMGLSLSVSSRLVSRIGARTLAVRLAISVILLAAIATAIAVAGDGRPSFWWWFVSIVVLNTATVTLNPIVTSLAMEPMGELAGTASAVMGLSSFGIGALLASQFDRRIEGTVTAMPAAYLVYGSLGFVLLLVAGRAASASPD